MLQLSENVMQLDYIRREIERMRTQVHRQRGESGSINGQVLQLPRRRPCLERMLNKIDELCAERDRLRTEHGPATGKGLGGRSW